MRVPNPPNWLLHLAGVINLTAFLSSDPSGYMHWVWAAAVFMYGFWLIVSSEWKNVLRFIWSNVKELLLTVICFVLGIAATAALLWVLVAILWVLNAAYSFVFGG